MQIKQQEQKRLVVQNIQKAFNIFIPKKKIISSKNDDKSCQSLLDKKVKECFQKYYQVAQKIKNHKINKPSSDLKNEKNESNKIFNPLILENLTSDKKSKYKKQGKSNQQKQCLLNCQIENDQKSHSKNNFINITEQNKSKRRVVSKCNTIRNIKTSIFQNQKNNYQNRSKTLDNYQKEESNQQQKYKNFIGCLTSQKDWHPTNENTINKLKVKKNKKHIPNSSYMFLNQRHKNIFDHGQNKAQHIQIHPQSKMKIQTDNIKKHLILKSNSNNKLIKRNKSYSKDKQIFSFLNLTPQNLKRSEEEVFIEWNQIQKHQQLNTFSHKKLLTSQFYVKKQKSTNKLHSYRKQKQKLKILSQNQKIKQINNYHNKKILQQIKNPLSSLGQLVNQILNLPKENQVEIPKQLGINKVKLAGQPIKTLICQKKEEQKQKKLPKKLKIKTKTKFNQICNVEPWQQFTQNNFYQTSKFLFNSMNQEEID